MPLPIVTPSWAHLDPVAGIERPRHLDDPDREQARPTLTQGARRAGVDGHPARVGFAYRSHSLKLECRASRASKRVPTSSPAAAAVRTPGTRPLAITVGIPAAVAISAATTLDRIPPEPSGEVLWPISRPSSASNSLTRSISVAPASVRGSEVKRPGGVGEQNEQLGREQDRHLRGEEVVVTERDLIGRGRVVLVDHRHDAPVQELAQRLAGVQVVGAGAHVEEREQHLSGRDVTRAQQLVVDLIQLALTDGARGLELVDRPGAGRDLLVPMPRAIAPLVTTTDRRPAPRSSAARSQIRARTSVGARRDRRRRCSSRA